MFTGFTGYLAPRASLNMFPVLSEDSQQLTRRILACLCETESGSVLQLAGKPGASPVSGRACLPSLGSCSRVASFSSSSERSLRAWGKRCEVRKDAQGA